MNPRYVMRQLGLLLLVLALTMGLTTALELAVAASHPERLSLYALLIGTVISAVVGGTFWYAGRGSNVTTHFNRRDAMLLVGLSWLIGAGLAAMPYYVWAKLGGPLPPRILGDVVQSQPHAFSSFAACYFESMSGLTTTGASVLAAEPYDIESLPKGLLLWRALTHWLGGLGIVVLFVAVLPLVGVGGKKLYQAEAPGPTKQGVRPRIKETARVLWLIYLTLTLAQMGAYKLAGLTWFDSACHAFATLATGGFSTRNASLGYWYANPWVEIITVAFMVLAGVNFGLYYQMVNRKWVTIYRDPELRLYLCILGVASLVIALCLLGERVWLASGQDFVAGPVDALRLAVFQTSSVQTTTGFATADFDRWEFLPKGILILLMFIGGCAGSTSGGIKVIRVFIAFKVIIGEFERIYRPQIVKPTRVGGGVVDPDVCRSVLIFIILAVALFALGAIGLMLLEPADSLGFISAATASAATLMNAGPGYGLVGPTRNYAFFSDPSLLLMSLLMVLGRLEIFSILVLLTPRFWSDK